jgi:hypothetical protein
MPEMKYAFILYSTQQAGLADLGAVPGAAGKRLWLP